jgi:hypothetical protein
MLVAIVALHFEDFVVLFQRLFVRIRDISINSPDAGSPLCRGSRMRRMPDDESLTLIGL